MRVMRPIVRWIYAVLAWAVFADLCLQFYFAAWGVFSKGSSDFANHVTNANIVMLLMLVALLAAIAASITTGLRWSRTIVHVVLPLLLIGQIGLFILHDALGGTEDHPISWVLGLHGLNGVLMLVLSLWLGVGAFRLLRTGTTGRVAGVA
jgi:hypothetical protein